MNGDRPSEKFIADALGLDFLNSILLSARAKMRPLKTGDDLLAWLAAAKLAPIEVLRAIKAAAVPGELDAVAAQARALGEWFRAFIGRHKGKPLPTSAAAELGPLNRLLARDLHFGQVGACDVTDSERVVSGLTWRPRRQWRSPDALLLPIAQAMVELVCDADFQHVKACEGLGCGFLFLDRTRGRARRWCSMASCGNRAKQAARREAAMRATDSKAASDPIIIASKPDRAILNSERGRF